MRKRCATDCMSRSIGSWCRRECTKGGCAELSTARIGHALARHRPMAEHGIADLLEGFYGLCCPVAESASVSASPMSMAPIVFPTSVVREACVGWKACEGVTTHAFSLGCALRSSVGYSITDGRFQPASYSRMTTTSLVGRFWRRIFQPAKHLRCLSAPASSARC
jgi:hypothetical protein